VELKTGFDVFKRPHNFARLILVGGEVKMLLLVTVVTTFVCRLPLSAVPKLSDP